MSHVSAALALLGILAVTPARAGDGFKQHQPRTVYVFGDSLSDNGNADVLFPDVFCPFWCQAPWAFPRFSNGPMWPDAMGMKLGKGIYPEADGGTNYALGGATISPEDPYNVLPAISGYAEVDTFLAQHGSANPDAIYVVWLGANDIDPPASYTQKCYDQLVVMLQRLFDAGARRFLIPNLQDLGALPSMRDLACSEDHTYCDQLTQMTAVWNGLLKQLPARFPKARIHVADYHGLTQMVTRFPGLFGFKNATEPCWRDWTDGWMCPDPDDYWYFDYSHPTTRAHKVISDFLLVNLLMAGELKVTDLVPATP